MDDSKDISRFGAKLGVEFCCSWQSNNKDMKELAVKCCGCIGELWGYSSAIFVNINELIVLKHNLVNQYS